MYKSERIKAGWSIEHIQIELNFKVMLHGTIRNDDF